MALLAAVAGARYALAVTSPELYEMGFYWRDIAERVARGEALYADTPYHFLPIWAWLLLLFRRLDQAGLAFPVALRSFLASVDLVSAFLVFRLARTLGGPVSPRLAALCFLANPVGIWVSCVQGQFDGLSILFLLAAVDFSLTRERAGRSLRFSGVWLFLSLAAKQVSAFHPLLWLRRKGGGTAAIMAYGGTALLLLAYASQWRSMARHFFTYTAVPRSYGFSEFVLYDARFAPVVGAVGLLGCLGAAVWCSQMDLPRGCLILFLVVLFFAPGMGSQYLIWPLAFGALAPGAGYLLFTACSTLWILGSHYGIPGSGRWMGHLVWLSVALWLAREVRSARFVPPVPANSRASA